MSDWDIHKASVAMAIADAGRAAPRFIGTINPSPAELCKALRRQKLRPEHTLLAYEVGPCGYGWVRYLRQHHWGYEVIAPSRLSRSPAEQRVKTDRRDALLLAESCALATSPASSCPTSAMKRSGTCRALAKMRLPRATAYVCR